jgi:acyl-coenzyme A synthetase/AMP-(fatty) acid ligase
MNIIDTYNQAQDHSSVISEIETGLSVTYGDFKDDVVGLSNKIKKSNLHLVMLVLPNSISFIRWYIACLDSECTVVPIPYNLIKKEIENIANYLMPDVIVTNRKELVSMRCDSNVYCTDINENELQYDSINFTSNVVDRDDLINCAAIYYSSGTTSNPKGIMYSYDNITNLISSICDSFKFSSSDKFLTLLPFGHTASINYNILPAIYSGASLFISQGFDSINTRFFETISKYRITYTQIVPTIAYMLNKLQIDTTLDDFSSLSFIGCGSSYLPVITQKEFYDNYHIKLANLYGLSETGPSHIDDPREYGWKQGSIGVPLGVNDCRINDNSEMELKGNNVFIGYYKNKKLYDTVVKDGWFNTGDVVEYSNGKYYYIDRSKDLIIKGGINILPAEIEEFVYKHKDIQECAVVPMRSEIFGDDICLVIKVRRPRDIHDLEHEIYSLLNRHLSKHKLPSKIIIVDEIPKTQSGKIMKRKVEKNIKMGMYEV